jgi:hypothetical protein
MTQPQVYDAGPLIALDRNDRPMWARYQAAVEDDRDIHVPAVVVAQAWRDGAGQVRLGGLLAGSHVDPVGPETAKAAGILCGRAGTADVTDAIVIVMAAALGAVVWTADVADLRNLAQHAGMRPAPVVCGL